MAWNMVAAGSLSPFAFGVIIGSTAEYGGWFVPALWASVWCAFAIGFLRTFDLEFLNSADGEVSDANWIKILLLIPVSLITGAIAFFAVAVFTWETVRVLSA